MIFGYRNYNNQALYKKLTFGQTRETNQMCYKKLLSFGVKYWYYIV